jgi:radical SAM superfamily enzyme YgiQ (UPF0313 family)
MKVHLVNPSHQSFGTAVITPRWMFVIAAATPRSFGDPNLVDETIHPFDPNRVQPGDVVGISIHTENALRGYTIGKISRERGAFVIFGGIHATLFPDEARIHGGAHAVVMGDGEIVWAKALADCHDATPQSTYLGGRVEASNFLSARWILYLASTICGPPCRPSVAVPNTARFVRSGRRMASAPASDPLME